MNAPCLSARMKALNEAAEIAEERARICRATQEQWELTRRSAALEAEHIAQLIRERMQNRRAKGEEAVRNERSDPMEMVAIGLRSRLESLYGVLRELRRREVQALHAGLSRRDWFSTEQAANQLRDKIDRALADSEPRP